MDLESANAELAHATAQDIVRWALDTFGDDLAMSTSFGTQSAAMLHLVTRVAPSIPVIWIDTGYLPAETYQHAERVTRQLQLNLHVYQAEMSPARMEALHGRLWEKDGDEGLSAYLKMRKVEPMERALEELGIEAWMAGLRLDQTSFRRDLDVVTNQGEIVKVHPILEWSERKIHSYIRIHGLPDHPLAAKGYVTVGDAQLSRPMRAGEEKPRATRYRGRFEECGLHWSRG